MTDSADASRVPAVDTGQREGLLLRVGGDVVVSPGEHVDTVIVVDGDAHIQGSADSIIVIKGKAVLDHARARTLFIMNGHADLRGNTAIAEDVMLVDSTLERESSVAIGGTVHTGIDWVMPGFWLFGVLLPLGLLLAFVLAGLAAAALAPRGVRRAGSALTQDIGKSLIVALLLWIVVPVAAVLSFAAIVTIPAGLGLFVFVLPALGLLGYLVVGIKIGDEILGAARKRVESRHPYGAAALGITILALIGLIPVIGGLVTLFSGLYGAGAVLVASWRTARSG